MTTDDSNSTYKPTLLGYGKKPAIIQPDAQLPAEKRRIQLENWRTYDKKMNIIERQKKEEEERKKKLEEEKKKLEEEQLKQEKENRKKERQERRDAGEENVETSEDEEETFIENTDNNNPNESENDKRRRIKFASNAIFLAACAAEEIEEVKLLLKSGHDVNTRNADGLTALHTACIDGKYKMCEILCSHGANINAADNEGWTPLHAAAGSGHLRIANFLVGQQANVAAVNCDGNLATDVTDDRACKLLLDGALLRKRIRNDEDKKKARNIEETMINTYIDECKEKFNQDPEQFILDLKTNEKTQSNILHVCASKGYIYALESLLKDFPDQKNTDGTLKKSFRDLNSTDEDGWTPLHAASHWEKQSCIDLLCEYGANIIAKNRFGQQPVDVMSNESPLYNHMCALTVEAKKKAEADNALRNIEAQKRAEEERAKEAQRLRDQADQQIEEDRLKREALAEEREKEELARRMEASSLTSSQNDNINKNSANNSYKLTNNNPNTTTTTTKEMEKQASATTNEPSPIDLIFNAINNADKSTLNTSNDFNRLSDENNSNNNNLTNRNSNSKKKLFSQTPAAEPSVQSSFLKNNSTSSTDKKDRGFLTNFEKNKQKEVSVFFFGFINLESKKFEI